MKKLSNLGKVLNKKEQKRINGGNNDCLPGIYEACTPQEEELAEAGDPFYICKCGVSLGWDPEWDILIPGLG